MTTFPCCAFSLILHVCFPSSQRMGYFLIPLTSIQKPPASPLVGLIFSTSLAHPVKLFFLLLLLLLLLRLFRQVRMHLSLPTTISRTWRRICGGRHQHHPARGTRARCQTLPRRTLANRYANARSLHMLLLASLHRKQATCMMRPSLRHQMFR
jgi:hypothetical protein